MSFKSPPPSKLLAPILAAVVLVTFAFETVAAPAPKPGSSNASATNKRPANTARTSQPKFVKRPSAKHQRMNRLKLRMTQQRSQINLLDGQIVLARQGEASLKKRHAASSTSRLRNQVRAATLERANLENKRSDALTQYNKVRTDYQQAHKIVNTSRIVRWMEKLGKTKKVGVRKARKLAINETPAPASGSGALRPNVQPKGILKTSTTYKSALEAKQANNI